jgi:hypothetical protein
MRRFAPSKQFPKGKVSYFVKFTIAGKQRRVTLGEVIDGNLKSMRLQASEILSKARLGHDTVAEAAAKAATVKNIVTLGEIVPKYLKACEGELRDKSLAEYTRYLERSWRPLHALAVGAITRQNVVTVVDDLEANSGKVAADRARTALSALFGCQRFSLFTMAIRPMPSSTALFSVSIAVSSRMLTAARSPSAMMTMARARAIVPASITSARFSTSPFLASIAAGPMRPHS